MDNRILAVAHRHQEKRARDRRRSSSPRTPTSASAPTRWASSPRTTTPSGSRSPSSTPASPSCSSPRDAGGPDVQAGRGGRAPGRTSSAPNQFVLLKDEPNPSHTAMGRFNAAQGQAGPAAARRQGRRLGHPAAEHGAELRAGPAAERRDQARHHRRQGGHRQDAAGHRRGPAQDDRGGLYQKLLVSRPIFPLGRDIGYLPGDVEQKLNPWMQPIFDNVEFLMNLCRADKKAGARLPRADGPGHPRRSSR